MKIYSPAQGKIIALEDVKDPVFSEKMMGDGIAIIPKYNKIYSPIKGKVTSIFPTKHAFGIVSEDNVEILIHIGLNTVDLKGKYFKLKVKQDDYVEVGDVLVEVDFKKLNKRGYDITTPVVILNKAEYASLEYETDKDIGALELIMELK